MKFCVSHSSVCMPFKYGIGSLVRYIDDKSNLMILDEHMNLKYGYGNIK